MGEIFEFRGVDNLVYAKVLTDTKEEFTTSEVKELSPVAEIGRTTSTSSESHYYDNQPKIVITSVGADEVSMTVAPLQLETLAEITGQDFDEETGTMTEGEIENNYFCIGYRTKGTDGAYRYVWRYKGQFSIPDETVATEDDSTTTNNTALTFTGIATTHKFTKTGKSAKTLVADERYGKLNLSPETYLTEVITPDKLETLKKTQG